jgi:hypothetical protein
MNEKNADVLDVSGLMENPKATRKTPDAQIRAQGGTAAVDSKSIVNGLIKQTLEAFLELEMDGGASGLFAACRRRPRQLA